MVRVLWTHSYGSQQLTLFKPILWLTAQPQPIAPFPGPFSVMIRPVTEDELARGFGSRRRHTEGWAADRHVGWVIDQTLLERKGFRSERKWVSHPFQHVKEAKAAAEELWPEITGWHHEKRSSRSPFHYAEVPR